MKSLFSVISLSMLAYTSSAMAEEVHGDIWLYVNSNQLVTGSYDHTTGAIISLNTRVFEAEFGIDPLFPFSGDEPGFGAANSPTGITFTMNLVPGLSVWNGSGYDASVNILNFGYGSQSTSSTTGGSLSFLGATNTHLHPEYTLSNSIGDPANGVYLAAFTYQSVGMISSDVFYVVFNLGMSEEDHAAATEWVEVNLVPTPAAFALLGLAGLISRRRRSTHPRL